jgi:hypothetical protein
LEQLEIIREKYIGEPAWDWYVVPSPSGEISERDAYLLEYWELVERLEDAPISPKKVSRRGANGITPAGRKKVRSGVRFLENEWGAKNLTFFTATLGNLSDEQLVTASQKWGEIVRRFNQKLQRLAKKLYKISSLPYVGVTEIQESRWRSSGIAVPHYHVVFPGRASSRSPWRYSISQLEGLWFDSVSEVLATEWSSPAACNTQGIKKSAASYISKYLSKGGKLFAQVKASGATEYLPHSWYSWSREVRVAVESARIKRKLPPLALSSVGRQVLQHLPGYIYSSQFCLETGQIVAVFGRVNPNLRDEFVESLLRVLGDINSQGIDIAWEG